MKKKINKELLSLFKKLNIKKNDKIIIHSNLACINQFLLTDKNDCANFFFEFLKKYIGKKGSIIIPTYNYDFTKKKKFNHKFTKSQVGFFGNYLLKKHYKRRTRDPIFSHLIFGRNSNAFFNIKYDSKMLLDLLGCISTHFHHKPSHGDPFQANFSKISTPDF